MPDKGFFGALFDLSFSSFITTKLIKFLYVLSLILIGLGLLAFIATSFRASAAGIFVLIIVAPVAGLFYVIYTRVILEIIMAVFRIMETNTELVSIQRQVLAATVPPTATAPPPPL